VWARDIVVQEAWSWLSACHRCGLAGVTEHEGAVWGVV
jgi:hypothetical protein